MDEIHMKALCDKDPLLQDLLQMKADTKSWREDRAMLGFGDREKVVDVLVVRPPLITSPSVEN